MKRSNFNQVLADVPEYVAVFRPNTRVPNWAESYVLPTDLLVWNKQAQTLQIERSKQYINLPISSIEFVEFRKIR